MSSRSCLRSRMSIGVVMKRAAEAAPKC